MAKAPRLPSLPMRRQHPLHAPAAAPAPVASPAAADGERHLVIRIGPLDHPEQADGIVELFRDISGLGRIEALPGDDPKVRAFDVFTRSADTDLLDLFTFHVSKEQIQIASAGAPAATAVAAPAPAKIAGEGTDFGFFDNAPGTPGEAPVAADAQAEPAPVAVAPAPVPAAPAKPAARADARAPRARWSRIQHAARVGQQGGPADQPGR